MGSDRQRIDKWLFFARAAKSRTLAAKMAQGGHVRVNGAKIGQASHEVKTGDVVTLSLSSRVLVYRIVDCGTRRGPAPEARLLYAKRERDMMWSEENDARFDSMIRRILGGATD